MNFSALQQRHEDRCAIEHGCTERAAEAWQDAVTAVAEAMAEDDSHPAWGEVDEAERDRMLRNAAERHLLRTRQ